ncbi:MAG TPA: ATP-binding cassette domain-containing protein [Desulfobulbus sp.]|nr:ATP-binding cassette domain-containing protein [Desulfobulbus sp.]
MHSLEVVELTFHGRGPYSFTIGGGECLGLAGPSGAGKTLLLRALADLDPHGGRISLGPLVCDQVPAPLWRRTVGMLPAESLWWYDRVGDHFVDFDRIPEQDLAMLGFDSSVRDWQISRLSSGEKQRLAILRLLQNRPRALLLDEPTASLDADNIGHVEELLTGYRREQGIPMLWVSHDPDQLERVAGRRLAMTADGRLLAGEA